RENAKLRLQYERATNSRVKAIRRSVGGAFRGGARIIGGAAAATVTSAAALGVSERIANDTSSAGLANRVLGAGANDGKSHKQVSDEIFNRSRSLSEKNGLDQSS